MSRSERLFDLLQALRRHRRAVSGRALAAETGVSLRTLYRDIASLQALGAAIEGEPGVGYLLKPGFLLPPLMFTPEELEALVLGSRWVAERTDGSLAAAAGNALARISAVLPSELQNELAMTTLLIGPSRETRRTRSIRQSCARRYARKPSSPWSTAMPPTTSPGVPSGRSRWPTSMPPVSCWPGVSCARTSAAFAPTASLRSSLAKSAIPSAARPC